MIWTSKTDKKQSYVSHGRAAIVNIYGGEWKHEFVSKEFQV